MVFFKEKNYRGMFFRYDCDSEGSVVFSVKNREEVKKIMTVFKLRKRKNLKIDFSFRPNSCIIWTSRAKDAWAWKVR
jgi:hypothetical protein